MTVVGTAAIICRLLRTVLHYKSWSLGTRDAGATGKEHAMIDKVDLNILYPVSLSHGSRVIALALRSGFNDKTIVALVVRHG